MYRPRSSLSPLLMLIRGNSTAAMASLPAGVDNQKKKKAKQPNLDNDKAGVKVNGSEKKKKNLMKMKMDKEEKLALSHRFVPYPFQFEDLPESSRENTASLSHEQLDSVLFQPGIHRTKDQVTDIHFLDPFFSHVPHPSEIDPSKLPSFVPPSADTFLHDLAKKHNQKFVASTSSVTCALSHVYYMISRFRKVQKHIFSREFKNEPDTFTKFAKKPAELRLILKDGVYAIDKHEDGDSTILSELGNIVEMMLTNSKEDFMLLKKNSESGTASTPLSTKQFTRTAYHYVKSGDLLFRSQLDCHHQKLPHKVFDLKTRATIPIRLDVGNYENYVNYRLTKPTGLFESFEREYYDMVRSAFLKFSMQVRIGKMDGIMVGFHNTREIFGFQYIPLSEMDFCVFGNSHFAAASFSLCVKIFNALLTEATKRFPDRDLQTTFYTHPNSELMVYVSPIHKKGEDVPIEDAKFYSIDNKPPESYYVIAASCTSKINGIEVQAPFVGEQGKEKWELSLHFRTEEVPASELQNLMHNATARDNSPEFLDLLKTFCKRPTQKTGA